MSQTKSNSSVQSDSIEVNARELLDWGGTHFDRSIEGYVLGCETGLASDWVVVGKQKEESPRGATVSETCSKTYIVRRSGSWCSCPAFKYHDGDCKHINMVASSKFGESQ